MKRATLDREMVLDRLKRVPDIYEEIAALPTKRSKKESPPGGISIREAARKYGLCNTTLSKWARQGYIKILLRTKNEVFIDEATVSQIAKVHKENGGRGKWLMRKLFDDLHS